MGVNRGSGWDTFLHFSLKFVHYTSMIPTFATPVPQFLSPICIGYKSNYWEFSTMPSQCFIAIDTHGPHEQTHPGRYSICIGRQMYHYGWRDQCMIAIVKQMTIRLSTQMYEPVVKPAPHGENSSEAINCCFRQNSHRVGRFKCSSRGDVFQNMTDAPLWNMILSMYQPKRAQQWRWSL